MVGGGGEGEFSIFVTIDSYFVIINSVFVTTDSIFVITVSFFVIIDSIFVCACVVSFNFCGYRSFKRFNLFS